MAGISLPDFGGLEQHFEDTVAALFASSGYVVQRRLRMRDPDELLELDTVATDYRVSPPRTIVVECKSGANWGWNDLFRLLGRMQFLGIPEGAVFAKEMPQGRTLEKTNRRLKPHGARCILLTDAGELADAFTAEGYATTVDETRLALWRYAFALERAIIGRVEQEAKVNRKATLPQRAANQLAKYYEQINSGIFFEPNLYRRLQRLYALWQASPRLTLGCAIELAGGVFDAAAPPDPHNLIIKDALYEGKHELVQAAMFIEQRARLAVLKAVVDLVIAGPTPKPILLVNGAPALTEWHFLPANVRAGVETIRQQPTFHQYPALWQQYLWTFGGFTLADRQPNEHAFIASAAQLPAEEADEGLRAFDRLFPLAGSWHRKSDYSQCRVVVMVPMPFQGLGAFHRKLLYAAETYADLGYVDLTAKDLSKWHSVGLQWLRSHGDLPMSTEAA
ncbi:MAG: hypothetical protein HY059_06005 [Proteobacteria bacterium]|nr:hypothetical protein [Pseudomonadota bacterium]